MLNVSDVFQDVMSSNVRPKIEPYIILRGVDNKGNNVVLEWESKDILNLEYKRGFDPMGRTLPFMELTWTEVLKDKLRENLYPEKYNNIVKNMEVELGFVQSLGFSMMWKNLFNNKVPWKDLIDAKISWKKLKNIVDKETVVMPSLFLVAKPTIEKNTIKWVARDLLSFIAERETKNFVGYENSVTIENIFTYFLINARSPYMNSPDLFSAFTDTINLLQEKSENSIDILEHGVEIISDDVINNILLNLASVYNKHWNFENNTLILKDFEKKNSVFTFSDKILFNYPKIQNNTNISNYSFKKNIVTVDNLNMKEKEPNNIEYYEKDGVNIYKRLEYFFDGYGIPYEKTEDGYKEIFSAPNMLVRFLNPTSKETIYVAPMTKVAKDENIVYNDVGESYVENNPLNPFGAESTIIQKRANMLRTYFNDKCSSIEFETIGNISLEPSDIVSVATNLYDANGKKITKDAMIIEVDIKYNGSVREKIIAHEVLYDN